MVFGTARRAARRQPARGAGYGASLRGFGVGAEIAARVQEHLFYELEAPVQRVAAVDVPTPYAKNLEQAALPNADDIVTAVLKIAT